MSYGTTKKEDKNKMLCSITIKEKGEKNSRCCVQSTKRKSNGARQTLSGMKPRFVLKGPDGAVLANASVRWLQRTGVVVRECRQRNALLGETMGEMEVSHKSPQVRRCTHSNQFSTTTLFRFEKKKKFYVFTINCGHHESVSYVFVRFLMASC